MQIEMSQTKVSQIKLQDKSRGIHNVCLPVHSEDIKSSSSTWRLSSAQVQAFSRKEAQAQKEICALRREVEERDAVIEEKDVVIKERDTVIKDRNGIIKGKNTVIDTLRTEVLQKSNMVRSLETEAKALKRADTMMELMGLRESGREAYDPL